MASNASKAIVFIIPPFLSAPLDLRRFIVDKFTDLYLLDVCVSNLCTPDTFMAAGNLRRSYSAFLRPFLSMCPIAVWQSWSRLMIMLARQRRTCFGAFGAIRRLIGKSSLLETHQNGHECGIMSKEKFLSISRHGPVAAVHHNAA